MRLYLRIFSAVLIAFALTTCGGSGGGQRTLSVVIYPFVPDQMDLFYQTKQDFEAAHPDINLQIIDLSENYYDPSKEKSVSGTTANVYELDTVFLQDFVTAKKIKVLPDSLVPAEGEVLANTKNGSMIGGVWYGVPHWVCGNFLFYLTSDTALANAQTLSDLKNVVTPSNGIFSDLAGKSNLGEYYIDVLNDRYGDSSAFQNFLTVETLDQGAVDDLNDVLNLCPAGYCRSVDFHERDGFYPRQFARRAVRAYVGYSESLYNVIMEIENSCSAADNCVDINDVTAGILPFDDNGQHQFSWVDSMVIDSGCTGQCEQDAITFIKFYTGESTILAALLPGTYRPVRYLLPARASLYANSDLLAAAPLYAKFKTMIENASTITKDGLVSNLNAIGAKLNETLPSH